MISKSAKTPAASKRGFSLLEMLAVITIMGILAVIIVPRIGGHTKKAKREACQQYKADINTAIERYWMETGAYPSAVGDLYPDYYLETLPLCPVTSAPYTIDASVDRVIGHTHP